jgi:hypothetical protein
MLTEKQIIEGLMETEEGRRLLARWAQDEEADLLGSELPPSGPDYDVRNSDLFVPAREHYPLTGGRAHASPTAAYMAESKAERDRSGESKGQMIDALSEVPRFLAPVDPYKRRPDTAEKIAEGDEYPHGIWRRMFPKARIEYTYPGDEDEILRGWD